MPAVTPRAARAAADLLAKHLDKSPEQLISQVRRSGKPVSGVPVEEVIAALSVMVKKPTPRASMKTNPEEGERFGVSAKDWQRFIENLYEERLDTARLNISEDMAINRVLGNCDQWDIDTIDGYLATFPFWDEADEVLRNRSRRTAVDAIEKYLGCKIRYGIPSDVRKAKPLLVKEVKTIGLPPVKSLATLCLDKRRKEYDRSGLNPREHWIPEDAIGAWEGSVRDGMDLLLMTEYTMPYNMRQVVGDRLKNDRDFAGEIIEAVDNDLRAHVKRLKAHGNDTM